MSEQYDALKRTADQAAGTLADLTDRLAAAKSAKTAQALRLNAAQEEYRRAGLLSPRRAQLKAEVSRQTAAYTAAAKEFEALNTRLDAARTEAEKARQALDAYAPEPPAVVQEEKNRPVRPVRTAAPAKDPAQRTARLLERLEQFYPEHQVFALDSISSDLRTRLLLHARHLGYAGVREFLEAQGWQCIRGEEVLALRRGRYCIPGQEPEIIRPQVESMLRRLEAFYPDRIIPCSIQREHKSLSQDATGLYQWLGYAGVAEMLDAYGFRYLASPRGGRPATDAEALIRELLALYGDAKPLSVQQMMQEHPEYAPALKTLQNRAPRLFGTSLRRHLLAAGLLAGDENSPTAAAP